MNNLYLFNKNNFKKHIVILHDEIKMCNNFYDKNFLFFCKKLLQNLKIVEFFKIVIFVFLKRYEKLVFIDNHKEVISYCFFQRKQKKYPFMNKLDIMLGNIFCDRKFRNQGYAYKTCYYMLAKNLNFYDNIYLMCDSKNIPSNRLALKCFFDFQKNFD
jgi:hypothetical protein